MLCNTASRCREGQRTAKFGVCIDNWKNRRQFGNHQGSLSIDKLDIKDSKANVGFWIRRHDEHGWTDRVLTTTADMKIWLPEKTTERGR
jgi:hypothetical protein